MPWWPEPDEDEDGFLYWPSSDPPDLQVEVSENPVVAELLGPSGEVIAQWLAREPIGYRLR